MTEAKAHEPSRIVPKQCSMSNSLPSKLAPQPPEKSVSPVNSASIPEHLHWVGCLARRCRLVSERFTLLGFWHSSCMVWVSG